MESSGLSLEELSGIAKTTIGPLLIGAFLNIFLFGIVLMQIRTYFKSSQDDPMWRKLVVGFILFIDTFNAVLVTWNAYRYSVLHFGDIEVTFKTSTVFLMYIISAGVVILTVQLYFAWQIKLLTQRLLPFFAVAILAVGQFAAEMFVIIRGAIYGDVRKWGPLKTPVIIWLVGAAVTDVLIAFFLTVWLRNKKTGFSQTDDIITKLTRLAVQTGTITAVTAIVDLVVYLAIPDNTHFILNLALSKLYTNCLLSSMNARLEWRNNWQREAQSDPAMSYSGELNMKPAPSSTGFQNALSVGGDVHISTSRLLMDDSKNDGRNPSRSYSYSSQSRVVPPVSPPTPAMINGEPALLRPERNLLSPDEDEERSEIRLSRPLRPL